MGALNMKKSPLFSILFCSNVHKLWKSHNSITKRARDMYFCIRELIFCCMWEDQKVDAEEHERSNHVSLPPDVGELAGLDHIK